VLKLRVSEVYLSIQGEGPRVGESTVFVRFAGCNLRCPGWACDTPHAIDPAIYTKDAQLLTPQEIVELVVEASHPGTNICYTGGEPFIQNSETLCELSDALTVAGYPTQEVFTNGTLEFPEWAYEVLYFVMDYKLSGSGEEGNIHGTEGVQATRIKNIQRMNEGDVVKFTIASRADYEEACMSYPHLQKDNPHIDFYYGVVWGKLEAGDLIAWVLEDGLTAWMYTHQLHNVIWSRDMRGI